MANPTTSKVSNSNSNEKKGLENNMANEKITLDNISAAPSTEGLTLSNEIGTWAELDSKNTKGDHIPIRGKVVRVDPREHAQHGIFQMWLIELTAPTVYYGDKDALTVGMPGDIVGIVESTDLQKYHDVVTDDGYFPEVEIVALPKTKTGKGFDFKPFKFKVLGLHDRSKSTATLSMDSLKAKFLGAGAGAAKSLPAAS